MFTTTEVAQALFVSDLQPSWEVSVGQTTAAVAEALRRHGGVRRCSAICAKEYGDHPEVAVTRMRWALALARELTDRSWWLPELALAEGPPNHTRPPVRPLVLACGALAVSTAGVGVAERSGRRAAIGLTRFIGRGVSGGLVPSAFRGVSGVGKLAARVSVVAPRSGVGLASAAGGVVGPACRSWLGAGRPGTMTARAEVPGAEGRCGHSAASQDWIIQHLFALGLRLQAAVAGSEIERVRERVDGVVADLDQVIVQVREGDMRARPSNMDRRQVVAGGSG